MRFFVALVANLILCNFAVADIVTGSASTTRRFRNPVSIFADSDVVYSGGLDSEISVTLSGNLDTDASTIDYQVGTLPIADVTKNIQITKEVIISGTPPTPPLCDLNGCTPGDPGTPPTIQQTKFFITID